MKARKRRKQVEGSTVEIQCPARKLGVFKLALISKPCPTLHVRKCSSKEEGRTLGKKVMRSIQEMLPPLLKREATTAAYHFIPYKLFQYEWIE
jgi:hypothetical protein